MRNATALSLESRHPGQGRLRPAVPATSRLALPLVVLAGLALLLWPTHLQLAAFDRVALPALLGLLATMNLAAAGSLPLPVIFAARVAMLGAWSYVLFKAAFVVVNLPAGLQVEALAPVLLWVPALLVSHSWRLPHAEARWLTNIGLLALLGLSGGALTRGADAGAALLLQVLLACGLLLTTQRSVQEVTRWQTRRRAWPDLDSSPPDPLTGLPGRSIVEGCLRQLSAQPGGVAVAVVRIDHAHRLEAERGEAFMERLTAHVARTLVEGLRDDDLVGRFSSRQFVLLLSVPDARAGRAACERLRLRVASRPIEGVNPSISVGLADVQDTPEHTLEHAEQALNDVTSGAFNRVQISAPAAQNARAS